MYFDHQGFVVWLKYSSYYATMLSGTYYAHNYASIIGGSLKTAPSFGGSCEMYLKVTTKTKISDKSHLLNLSTQLYRQFSFSWKYSYYGSTCQWMLSLSPLSIDIIKFVFVPPYHLPDEIFLSSMRTVYMTGKLHSKIKLLLFSLKDRIVPSH